MMEKNRTESGSVYEYSEPQGAYLFIGKLNGRTLRQFLKDRDEPEPLTMRSKIQVRWSTAPDVGYPDYPGQKTSWLDGKPEVMGIRKAATFERDLDQRIGQGVFRVVSYRHNGYPVSLDEIRKAVFQSELQQTS
jgi:hypothetical protein